MLRPENKELTPVRRRATTASSAGGCAPAAAAAGAEDAAASAAVDDGEDPPLPPASDGEQEQQQQQQQQAGGMLGALYSLVAGAWAPEHEPQARSAGVPAAAAAQHSFTQALGDISTWALRAAMINTCMPLLSPAGSRSGSPEQAEPLLGRGDPTQPPSLDSDLAAGRGAGAGGATGRDVAKGGGGGKQPQAGAAAAGAQRGTGKSPSGGTLAGSDQQAAPGPAAATAAGMAGEVERLMRELCQLREENERLRSGSDAGEELLGGALQQLLGEKSALQLEVSRLSRANQALQELLEFTAGAAGPPSVAASEGGASSWAYSAAGDGGAAASPPAPCSRAQTPLAAYGDELEEELRRQLGAPGPSPARGSACWGEAPASPRGGAAAAASPGSPASCCSDAGAWTPGPDGAAAAAKGLPQLREAGGSPGGGFAVRSAAAWGSAAGAELCS